VDCGIDEKYLGLLMLEIVNVIVDKLDNIGNFLVWLTGNAIGAYEYAVWLFGMEYWKFVCYFYTIRVLYIVVTIIW